MNYKIAIVLMAICLISKSINAETIENSSICFENCTTTKYHETEVEKGFTESKIWKEEKVKFENVEFAFDDNKINHPKRTHCTDKTAYDNLFANLGTQNANGYTLDKDGVTIWGPGRKQIYRCIDTPKKQKDFDFDKFDHLTNGFVNTGYWQTIKTEWFKFIEKYSTITICTIDKQKPIPTPEPGTFLLFGIGAFCVFFKLK